MCSPHPSTTNMYLIDDSVYLKPFDRNRFQNLNGIIKDILELSNGEMVYDVEVEGSADGNHLIPAVPEDHLMYRGNQ